MNLPPWLIDWAEKQEKEKNKEKPRPQLPLPSLPNKE